jgi:membrane-associated protease RseP (regulator of RpoE activity)
MKNRYLLHVFLFLVTVLTTLMAGAELVTGRELLLTGTLSWSELWRGIPFSFTFLAFLTVHEFGHYFLAMAHRVKCSLPYYIPIFIPGAPNIGSFGAVIRIRELPSSRKKYFDIGVAGPLAGFVVAIGTLIYGFTHLPPLEEYIYSIHDYKSAYGGLPSEAMMENAPGVLRFGGSLFFEGMIWLFRDQPNMPPSYEMQHYPFLLVGFLTLFFTALNLLPIGQLDGGHITYGLFGARRAGVVSRVAVFCLLLLGGTGILTMDDLRILVSGIAWYEVLFRIGTTSLYLILIHYVLRRIFSGRSRSWLVLGTTLMVVFQFLVGSTIRTTSPGIIWLLYSWMAVRMVGLDHPVAPDDSPLSLPQKVLAWSAFLIFVLCFSPNPIHLT